MVHNAYINKIGYVLYPDMIFIANSSSSRGCFLPTITRRDCFGEWPTGRRSSIVTRF